MSAGLGLLPHEVALSEPVRAWADEFEQEKRRLAEVLGDLVVAIEHVGSTAVPALRAKPIIDIAIAVAPGFDIATISSRLEAAGYEFAVNAGTNGGYIFFREARGGMRTHHLHVIESTDPQWSNYLKFRECLRRDEQLRREYESLKARLARQFPSDREAYTESKAAFIIGAIDSVDSQSASDVDDDGTS